MKRFLAILMILSYAAMAGGCAAAWKNAAYTDDLYSIHNKIEIANRQKAEAELAKAQYEAEQAQYEAALARVKAAAAQQGVEVTEGTYSSFNAYDAVLADDYESAYARRLYGFSSPTYRMPSSYYSLRYSDAFHYASAYDPAFYNIMISGDMVWVEPKYITSMFGSWGAAVVPSYGWYYGWNDPFYYWNRPYGYGWNWNWYWNSYWGWNYPYYWGWGYPYYPYYNHHHHHHHNPHRPPHHNDMHHHGGVGSTGVHHNRPGMVVGRNPGASRPADRGAMARPSQPSSGRTTQPSYNSRPQSSGSSSYRGGSSSGYSGGSSTYRGGSSSSSSSYRSSSPSISSGGGGYSSSSSSGGNSRGR